MEEQSRTSSSRHHAGKSVFLPALIALLSLVVWFSFQAFQLYEERDALNSAHAAQEQQMAASTKLRASLETMANDTARLAQQGNANARLLVEELRKRGVTINPPDTPAAPDAEAK